MGIAVRNRTRSFTEDLFQILVLNAVQTPHLPEFLSTSPDDDSKP